MNISITERESERLDDHLFQFTSRKYIKYDVVVDKKSYKFKGR